MNLFSQRKTTPNFLFEAANDKGSTVKMDWPDEVRDGFKNLVDRKGGEGDAARKLYEENYELRKEKRALQEKIENVNTLSDEDLKSFEAYKEINDDPEQLKEVIENAEQDTDKLNRLEREKANADVAEVQGWNPKVFNRLADEGAEYEIKTRQVDGEDEKYAVIKTEDGEKDLSEHAKNDWSDMMPALKNGSTDTTEEPKGKQFTSQSSASDGKSTKSEGYLDKFKKNNKKAAGLKAD